MAISVRFGLGYGRSARIVREIADMRPRIGIPPALLWKFVRLPCHWAESPARNARRRRPPALIEPSRLRRILVHAPNWLGDAIMSFPLLDHLHETCPSAVITVVSRPQSAGLWELHPDVDEVVSFDALDPRLRPAAVLRFVRRLRNLAADAAFILPGGVEFALFHALAGIRIRVGYDSDSRHALLTHPIAEPLDLRARHFSESYLDLGRLLAPVSAPIPRSPLRARFRDEVAKTPSAPRVVLHPWADYGPAKRWPPERFAELGTRLAARFGAEIILVGTPAGQTAAIEIARLMRTRVRDLTGRTSIAELCTLMAGSALVVSNDSGPAHLADALDVPLVVLFGSSSPRWTAPRGPRTATIYHQLECSPCFQRTCRLGTYACLEGITVDEVFVHAERLLTQTHAGQGGHAVARAGRP